MSNLVEDLKNDAREIAGDLAALRHALHLEPELGLELPRTQEKVLGALDGCGLELTLGTGLNSVTGVLRGARPGPTVLLRGDMDALPLQETSVSDVPISRFDGVMHACGHDLHTSMLVGAAKLLSDRREQLAGNVVFMFQPGEEGEDGAGHMIAEGVLDASGVRPSAAYALHVSSGMFPRGTFGARPGPMMASCSSLHVTVHGAGGHGSAPFRANDPIPAACEMVTALQTAVTRKFDIFDPVVVTVGSFHSGTKENIIPETAHFDATVRTFSAAAGERMRPVLVGLIEGIAKAHGLEVEVVYDGLYPATVNDAHAIDVVRDTVGELFGPERFETMAEPLAGAEDFSRVLQQVPGAMVFLGATIEGRDHHTSPWNHSPEAAFDDRVLPDGATLLARLALDHLVAA
ncbi:M20 metallopeptidase family protein [Actinospica robiniae]|uniref:M20 metallopeptidase family protein n=1 Tax=Actinospica robiniae TaxID=304901 RepID=UPI00055740EA|nr:M20 family metallopeptidase [Actinospica robiniae]